MDAVPATQTSYVAGNLTLASAYSFRVRASNLTGDSPYSSVASATTPGLTLNLNFANGNAGKPINTPAPGYPGYLADIGQSYGVRTNGNVYGWSLDNTTNAIWRTNAPAAPDTRYATLQIMQGAVGNRQWEIALPAGSYRVHVVGGDPGPGAASPMVEQFSIEGNLTEVQPVSAAAPYAEFTNIVQVTDGRLTITNGPSATNNTIDYVDLQALATPPLTLARASGDNTLFHTLATFSSSVDPVTATDPANYLITNNVGDVIAVGSAAVQADGRTVLLATPLQNNTNIYTVVVSNVLNVFGDRIVAPGSRASYVNTVPVPCTRGILTVEVYSDIMGNPPVVDNNLRALTNNVNYILGRPSEVRTTSVGGFSFNSTAVVNYGAKLYGYFIAPSNGLYRFYVRSDDASNLWLNSGTNSAYASWDPAGKTLIAWENGCCGGFRGAAPYMSADFPMTGGQFYYMEAIYEQGGGEEYVQFAFKERNDPSDPPNSANVYLTGVPDSIQSPFLATPLLAIQPISQPVPFLEVEQNRSASFAFSATLIPSPDYFRYQWTKNGTNIPGATGIFASQGGAAVATLTIPIVPLTDNGSVYVCKVNGAGLSYQSDPAYLSVIQDTTPPAILSAGSLNGWQIGIRFDGRMEGTNVATAVTNINLYGVDFGLSVTVVKATRPSRWRFRPARFGRKHHGHRQLAPVRHSPGGRLYSHQRPGREPHRPRHILPLRFRFQRHPARRRQPRRGHSKPGPAARLLRPAVRGLGLRRLAREHHRDCRRRQRHRRGHF